MSGLAKRVDSVYHRNIILMDCFLTKSDESGYPVIKLGDWLFSNAV
jgi:hypothetical protein